MVFSPNMARRKVMGCTAHVGSQQLYGCLSSCGSQGVVGLHRLDGSLLVNGFRLACGSHKNGLGFMPLVATYFVLGKV
jgi:hypothetical protein